MKIGSNRRWRDRCTLEREASKSSHFDEKQQSWLRVDELRDNLGERIRITDITGKDDVRRGRELTLRPQLPDGYAWPHLAENDRPPGAQAECADVARGDAALADDEIRTRFDATHDGDQRVRHDAGNNQLFHPVRSLDLTRGVDHGCLTGF